MIVDSAFIQFKLGIDKVDSFNSVNFLTEEIDQYLSDAQEEFIEQRAYGNNFKKLGLEETQKRVKDLQSIEVNANLNNFFQTVNNKPNGYYVSLPDGVQVTDESGTVLPAYRHAINEEVIVQVTDCNGNLVSERVPVVPITNDKYNKVIANPFSQPSKNKVYRLPAGRFTDINGTSLEHFELILNSSQTLLSYNLRYLFNPRKIDKAQILDPPGLPGTAIMDLTDESYREIIRIAVRNALGDIQTSVQEAIERNTEVE